MKEADLVGQYLMASSTRTKQGQGTTIHHAQATTRQVQFTAQPVTHRSTPPQGDAVAFVLPVPQKYPAAQGPLQAAEDKPPTLPYTPPEQLHMIPFPGQYAPKP